jgi:hypothetical protein
MFTLMAVVIVPIFLIGIASDLISQEDDPYEYSYYEYKDGEDNKNWPGFRKY